MTVKSECPAASNYPPRPPNTGHLPTLAADRSHTPAPTAKREATPEPVAAYMQSVTHPGTSTAVTGVFAPTTQPAEGPYQPAGSTQSGPPRPWPGSNTTTLFGRHAVQVPDRTPSTSPRKINRPVPMPTMLQGGAQRPPVAAAPPPSVQGSIPTIAAPLSSSHVSAGIAAHPATRGGTEPPPGCTGGNEAATGASAGVAVDWRGREGMQVQLPPGPLPPGGGSQSLGGGLHASLGGAQRPQAEAEQLRHPTLPRELVAEEMHALFPGVGRGKSIRRWLLDGNKEARSTCLRVLYAKTLQLELASMHAGGLWQSCRTCKAGSFGLSW